MSQTFVVESGHRVPGSASLRVEVGEGGIRQLTPRVLGAGLLAAPAGPYMVMGDGRRSAPLADYIGSAPSDDGWLWILETELVTGTWEATFRPDGFVVEFDLEVIEDTEFLAPLAVPLCARSGWLLLPGGELPIDLMDMRLGTQRVAVGAEGEAAWSYGSQGGFLVQAIDSSRAVDAIRVHRQSEHVWAACIAYENLKAGERIRGKIDFRLVPYNGAMRLEQVMNGPMRMIPEWLEFPGTDPDSIAFNEATLELTVAGVPVRIALEHDGVPLEPSDFSIARVDVRDVDLHGQAVSEVTVALQPWDDIANVRIDVEAGTPCGNPTWEGDATVFIPGNFARCNYHPDHLHGGGPKWGPSPVPVCEPNTANDSAPGQCHGWTFAGSRLPQVWAAAADRKAGKFVWIGTTPRSDFGENCAGFVSPEGETTTLKLATPTTYEPWVPLGYSRMRPEARRDGAFLEHGRTSNFTFYVAARDTADLNAWAPLERALYLRNRPLEPTPLKLTRDEAIRVCASAIHDRFYDATRETIRYSTGPQGAQSLVGFTGMAHSALVMLWAGGEFGEQRWSEAGTKVLDTAAEMFLAGPEFPWTLCEPDKRAFRHGSGEPGYVVMVAFDNLAEAVRRERAAGREHPKWLDALRKCARAWAANQAPDGAYPHWGPGFAPDFKENEYAVTNVEAGVLANMVDAYELLGDEAFLASARKAAEKYGRDLDDGRLWGGPGDIRALVNSEVPMFFLRGFRRLYEITKEEEHKRWLLAAAAWRASFQYAHSWPVDPGSPLWRQGWSGLGAESASACNLHAVAFGCINVPDYWALWKMTGDKYHLKRCEDLVRYSAQQYARFKGDLGFPFAGAGTESFWTSDTVWGKGTPWIFTDPGFDLGYMSWVTGWSGYGALWARELGIEF
ncbi:MAG: hypothetical protein PWP23_2835 [Candidatus Sumerlaeota bacterium]|nr:hypothetical protein [Candidatus Sumerlaeota bacterium]